MTLYFITLASVGCIVLVAWLCTEYERGAR